MSRSSTTLVTLENLDVTTPAGRPLFHGLNMEISAHDQIAMIGRNGVGKTTLLRILTVKSIGQRPGTIPLSTMCLKFLGPHPIRFKLRASY